MWVNCREAERFLVNSMHTHTQPCDAGGCNGGKQQNRQRCEKDERSCCVSVSCKWTRATESSGAVIRSLT